MGIDNRYFLETENLQRGNGNGPRDGPPPSVQWRIVHEASIGGFGQRKIERKRKRKTEGRWRLADRPSSGTRFPKRDYKED
jgi:hypothetical protein